MTNEDNMKIFFETRPCMTCLFYLFLWSMFYFHDCIATNLGTMFALHLDRQKGNQSDAGNPNWSEVGRG